MLVECTCDRALGVIGCVGWQKRHDETHAIAGRNSDPVCRELSLDEAMRDGGHHAGAVAGAIGRSSPTVVEIVETRDTELHDAVGRRPRTVRDEADATGVVLEVWVVERVARNHCVCLSSDPLSGCGATECRGPDEGP